MKTFIIIPAYNEEKVISSVIKKVQRAGYRNIIVVDDGSTDLTFEKAKKAKTITLRHLLNRGKGAAVKTGMEAAKLFDSDAVITMDADGQHDPQDIKRIVSKLEKGYDLVLGTRRFSSQKIPGHRKMGNHIGNIFTFFIYGQWVNDSQSGFRGFSRRALHKVEIKSNRYEYESEIIREMKKHNLKYIEQPINITYSKYSQSKVQKQNVINGVKTLLRLLLAE